MFSLCMSVHRGGGSYPTMHWECWTPPPTPAPAPPGPAPPPTKFWTKKFWTKSFGQKSFGQKVLDKKVLDKKFWTKKFLDKKFWKLLEVGSAGGTPLAVTQEDCLVIIVILIFIVRIHEFMICAKYKHTSGLFLFSSINFLLNLPEVVDMFNEYNSSSVIGHLVIFISSKLIRNPNWSRFLKTEIQTITMHRRK